MEKIKLQIPNKTKYSQSLRLLISSFCDIAGFDCEELVDIMVCVSEFMLISKKICEKYINLEIELEEGAISLKLSSCVDIDLEKELSDEDKMSIMVLKSLMDEVIVNKDNIIIKKSAGN